MAAVGPDEISGIIKQQIEQYDAELKVTNER